jgi:DNA repair protein RadD
MWVLRDYQAHAVAQSVRFLKGGRDQGGLVVLPTGAGKSLVIAGTVRELDQPCLIFQPSKEILEQNASKLIGYGYEPKVFSASMKTKEIGSITLATIGSVKDVPDLFDSFPYVLVDEAHLVNAKTQKVGDEEKSGMYKEFLTALGDVRIVGLTATPYRLNTDGWGGSMLKFLTRTRPRIFSNVLAYAQIADLIAQGYLVRPDYQIVSGFNRQELEMNSTGADYTDDSVRRQFNRIGFNDRVRRVVRRLLEIGRKSILVFTRFVDEAHAIAEAVPDTAVVSARTKPGERTAIVTAFRTGAIKVVANVGVLSLGFDFPELETVVLARPTMSLTLYYQQVGRLLRPHPTKTSAWVVDMVDQVGQFGKIEDLWLQPGGATGAQWEMVTKANGIIKPLTNIYFGESRFQPRARDGRHSKHW